MVGYVGSSCSSSTGIIACMALFGAALTLAIQVTAFYVPSEELYNLQATPIAIRAQGINQPQLAALRTPSTQYAHRPSTVEQRQEQQTNTVPFTSMARQPSSIINIASIITVTSTVLLSLSLWLKARKPSDVLQPLLGVSADGPSRNLTTMAMVTAAGEVSDPLAARQQATQKQMLTSLVLVRRVLHEELMDTLDPRVQQLTRARETTLPDELQALLNTIDLENAMPSAARDSYISRIRTVAQTAPYVLIAHERFWHTLADQMLMILGAPDSLERQQQIRMRMQLVSASIALEDELHDVSTFSTNEIDAIVDENDFIYNINLHLLSECQDPELMQLYGAQLEAVRERILGSIPPMTMASTGGMTEEEAKAAEEQEKEQEFLRRIDAEIRELTGEGFDALLSPSKVVRLEKELLELREELAGCTDPQRRDELEKIIAKKADESLIEKRGVMKGWLGTVFRVQAVISAITSGLLASNHFPGIADVDLPIRALGFWSWWLFTIPSLRAIKPLAPQEKSALDWAFLGTLFASLLAPAATRDTGAIWLVDAVVVAGCYAVSYAIGEQKPQVQLPPKPRDPNQPLNPVFDSLRKFGTFAATALDFGSGRERGTVETENKTIIEKELEKRLLEKVSKLKEEGKE